MKRKDQLTGFCQAISKDARIRATHISLYLALLYKWNLAGSGGTISVNRDEIMQTAKISARATYNRCMRDLHEYGYITYKPSSHPFQGSQVTLRTL